MKTYYGARSQVVRYGPDVPADDELKLLGNIEGLRVLELGSGSRSSAVALAKQGAHVIVVDPHPERIAEARSLADDEEVRAEWHEVALSDLAFLRGDSMDLAFSAGTVLEVEDLSRLLRQVHRVLKAGAHFVFSYEHPMALVQRGRSYYDDTPVVVEVDGVTVEQFPRPVADVFMALVRTGFRPELMSEPRPIMNSQDHPTTVIWRVRKEGV